MLNFSDTFKKKDFDLPILAVVPLENEYTDMFLLCHHFLHFSRRLNEYIYISNYISESGTYCVLADVKNCEYMKFRLWTEDDKNSCRAYRVVQEDENKVIVEDCKDRQYVLYNKGKGLTKTGPPIKLIKGGDTYKGKRRQKALSFHFNERHIKIVASVLNLLLVQEKQVFKCIGSAANKTHDVHHISGDFLDDSISNLKIMSMHEHRVFHKKWGGPPVAYIAICMRMRAMYWKS